MIILTFVELLTILIIFFDAEIDGDSLFVDVFSFYEFYRNQAFDVPSYWVLLFFTKFALYNFLFLCEHLSKMHDESLTKYISELKESLYFNVSQSRMLCQIFNGVYTLYFSLYN